MTSTAAKPPITIRQATEADIPFVFNSWLKSYRTSQFASPIDNTIFFSEHHKVIERILRYYDVRIACSPEDPDQIHGFICAGYTDGIFTLHYIYVKHPFRRLGVAKELYDNFPKPENAASLYTHQTRASLPIAPKYNLIFHPYLAYDPAAYNGDKPYETFQSLKPKKETK